MPPQKSNSGPSFPPTNQVTLTQAPEKSNDREITEEKGNEEEDPRQSQANNITQETNVDQNSQNTVQNPPVPTLAESNTNPDVIPETQTNLEGNEESKDNKDVQQNKNLSG